MVLEAISRLDFERPRWGRARHHEVLASHGFPMSEATVGRILAAVRERCAICGGHERHFEGAHAMSEDMRQMLGR